MHKLTHGGRVYLCYFDQNAAESAVVSRYKV